MKNKIKFMIILIILFIIIIFLAYSKNNINGLDASLKGNIISIPVNVYIVKYNDEKFSSIRDEENINEVFNNVNAIWSQANIKPDVKKVEKVIIDDTSYYNNLNSLLGYMTEMGNYDPNKINVYFAQTLHGANGIAFPGNRIMVADVTSVYDFRATSHEIGHVLGLSHVTPNNRLMARGVNGFELTQQEINIARNNALIFFLRACFCI